ncbi:MAG: hypothetical protein JSU94_10590 [Phycisphaerales bacterium]|nr:MAG: hypothetical protein JSU94_10590 [Phycisphaerales bacterium]
MDKQQRKFNLTGSRTNILLCVGGIAAATLVYVCVWSGPAVEDKNSRNTAEWFYRGRQIRRVVQQWQESVKTTPLVRGRISDSYHTYLVIDTNEPAIWIEDWGRIREDARMKLPRSMKWRLYHRTPNGDNVLSGLTRLRFKDARRLVSEQFYLVGTEGTERYLGIMFGPGTSSQCGFKPWAFVMPRSYAWEDEPQEQVRSVVVGEDEYERNLGLARRQPATGTPQTQASGHIPPIVAQNEARWLAIEKKLYLEIERQLSDRGYDLTHIAVDEGPAMTAAIAMAEGRKLGWLDKIYRGRRTDWKSCSVDLKIDYLGDGLWYVVSDPDRRRRLTDKYLDLEFLVGAKGRLSGKKRKEWLEKGRLAAKTGMERPSPWRVTLENGISVELIGICMNPSDGREWWGPDGAALDYVPYYYAYTIRREPDESVYEIAYNVTWPNGMPQRGGSPALSECVRQHAGGGLEDRFGDDSPFRGRQRRYVFKQSTQKTTMRWIFGNGDHGRESVAFKNVSLVPGKDFGFEVETYLCPPSVKAFMRRN